MTDKDITDLKATIFAVEMHLKNPTATVKNRYLPSVGELRKRWGIRSAFYTQAEQDLKRLYREQVKNAA